MSRTARLLTPAARPLVFAVCGTFPGGQYSDVEQFREMIFAVWKEKTMHTSTGIQAGIGVVIEPGG